MRIRKEKGIPMINGLPLATVGKHTDSSGKEVTYTLEELQETAKLNNKYLTEGKWCPLVLTHEDNNSALKNNEVYAKAKTYYVENDTLKTNLEVTEGKEKELTSGRFEPVSMRRIINNKRIYHIALVGDQAISAASLKNASFENFAAEFGEFEDIQCDTEKGGEELENEDVKDETFSVEKEKSILQKFFDLFSTQKTELREEIKKTLEEFKQPEKVNEEEDMDNLEEFNALKAKVKEYEDYKAQVEEDKKNALIETRKKEANGIVEDFCEKGQMLPCQKELALKILNSDVAEEFKQYVALSKLVDFDTDLESFAQSASKKDKTTSDTEKAKIVESVKNCTLEL
jgi:hypothetical protein